MAATTAKTLRRSRTSLRMTEAQREVGRLDYYDQLRGRLESPFDISHPEVPKGLAPG